MLFYLFKYIVFIDYYYLHASYANCVSVCTHVCLWKTANQKLCNFIRICAIV